MAKLIGQRLPLEDEPSAPSLLKYKTPQVEKEFAMLNPQVQEIIKNAGPARVTSGFRSPEENMRVGGVPGSYHTKGLATDLSLDTDPAVLEKIKQQGGKVIRESDHNHIQFPELKNTPKKLVGERLPVEDAAYDGPSITADTRSGLQKLGDRAKYEFIKTLQGGGLESAGALGGGLFGAAAGLPVAGPVGSAMGAPTGAALGAAFGKNVEDAILGHMGLQPHKTLTQQTLSDLGAAGRGATAEMTGQVGNKGLAVAGEKLLSPVGRVLEERVAPRMMTSVVKDPELAQEMLKRGEWGTTRGLFKGAEEKVGSLSSQIDDILGKVNKPIDRTHIMDELESLRKEYARLDRPTEVASIEEMKKRVLKGPTTKEIEKGFPNYKMLTPSEAQELKKGIYAEHKKLYAAGNYDPSSIQAQKDLKIAKGYKEAIEEAAPEVAEINPELGHHIQVRDTMETLSDKAQKSNILQLRPMLAGLGMLSQGAMTAGAAPIAMNLMGSTVGGTGGAQLAKKLGQRLLTRSGTPITGAAMRGLSEQGLQELDDSQLYEYLKNIIQSQKPGASPMSPR